MMYLMICKNSEDTIVTLSTKMLCQEYQSIDRSGDKERKFQRHSEKNSNVTLKKISMSF